jgi:uncharacterized protein (TIGR01777 family)
MSHANDFTKSKVVVLTGGTGFIGTALTVELLKKGYKVRILTRDASRFNNSKDFPVEYFSWNPTAEEAPLDAFENAWGVVHLAGEAVAGSRWSAQRKKDILESRSIGTVNLVSALNRLQNKPSVLVGTSAIGYFGDRKNEHLDEFSQVGRGFLPDVCKIWEEETRKIKDIRLAIIRVGIVLGTDSGALKQMLPIFRVGLGGPLGNGSQWMSWIHLEDLVQMYIFALEGKNVEGVLNGVAPEAVQNKEFTKALSRALGRPAFFPAPSIGIKLAFGEMSSIILSSQKVFPKKALEFGFRFKFSKIQDALNDLLSPKKMKGAYTLEAYQWLPIAKDKVFQFFSDAHNLEAITPRWLNFRIDKMSDTEIKKNTLIDYSLKVRGIPIKWKTLIEEWQPENSFVDRMLKGPYKNWHHTHTFYEMEGGTLICDRVYYRIPMGVLGNFVGLVWVESDVEKIFAHRRKAIREIFKV